MKEKELFKMNSVIKKVDEEKRQVTSIISTETEDRDKDIIEVRGWDLSNYKKNPVVLWGHNYSTPPIARTISITRDNKAKELVATREYPEEGLYPFADTIFNLVMGGFQRTVSVGFKPTKFTRRDSLAENHPHYVEGNPESYFNDTGILFQKQELLEYSDVPIPANPAALNLAYEKGIIGKEAFESLEKIPCYSCPKVVKGLCSPDKECISVIKYGSEKATGKQTIFKGWDNNDCKIIIVDDEETEEMNWDRGEALKGMKEHCDFVEGFNFEEYKKGFAWIKDGDLKDDTLSKDFKILHHYVDEKDKIKVSRDGVLSALQVMGDQRSKGIPADDRIKAYTHLAEHAEELGLEYKDFQAVQIAFQKNAVGDSKTELKEGMDALARKLNMATGAGVDVDYIKVLEKAFDSIVSKAVVVQFASLEPAVTALEADFKDIKLEGKSVDTEHKTLFKRLLDIAALIEKNGLAEGSEGDTGKETEEEEYDFLGEIDKAFDGVQKAAKPESELGELLKTLHKEEDAKSVFSGVDNALDSLSKSVQS